MVRLSAASVLRARQGKEVKASLSLTAGDEPTESMRSWSWDHKKLDLCWRVETTVRRPFQRELLRDGNRTVQWRCHVPAGRVSATMGIGSHAEQIEGIGYAEELEMTVAPWDLPIRELRWGRALSERTSIIWIEWRGPQPLLLVFVNGKLESESEIGDNFVRCRGVEVCLAEGRTIRDGPIGTNALAGVPGVASWAPAAFLSAHETKWVARAEIRSRRRVRQAWAIHEVVRFGAPQP